MARLRQRSRLVSLAEVKGVAAAVLAGLLAIAGAFSFIVLAVWLAIHL
jgi:hypothetical protein